MSDKIAKFISGYEALNIIIKVQRNPKDKFGHGSKIEKVVHGEELTICYFCGKVGGSAPRNTTCLCGCEIYRQVHRIVK